MVARIKGGRSPPNSARGGKGGGKGGGQGGGQANVKTLKTQKGLFSFTMVADGCYIEHKWGQNSGHVGVPLESMPLFIKHLETLYQATTGEAVAKKSPGGPAKRGIVKGGKKSPVQTIEKKEKPKKEKKEPPAKKTPEELDAELMEYTAARSADAPVEEAPAAEA